MTEDWVTALGVAMCKQWGINPDECYAIDIRWRPHEMPTATVELHLNEGVVHEVMQLAPASRARTHPE